MAKATKTVEVIPALRTHVTAIKRAYQSLQSTSAKIGTLVIKASADMKESDIEPFVGMVKAALVEVSGMTDGTIKAICTHIRRVTKALIIDGFEPDEGMTLRQMYDAIGKTQTGAASHGNKSGARTPNAADDDPADNKPAPRMVAMTAAEIKAQKTKQAITDLFGTHSAELEAAIEYAVNNSGVFMSWAKASAAAMQKAELEKFADTMQEVEKAVTPPRRLKKAA